MPASGKENRTEVLAIRGTDKLQEEVVLLREEKQALMDELENAYKELAEMLELSQDETDVAYAELREKLGWLVRLGEIGKVLSSELKLDVLIEVLLVKVAEMVGYDTGCFMRFCRGDEYEITVQRGSGEDLVGRRVRVKSFEGEVLVVGDFDCVEELVDEFRLVPEARSGVVMTMGRGDYGLLVLNRREPHRFKESDRVSLSAFATQASIAVENARLFDSLSEQASVLMQKSERLSKIWEITGSLLSNLNLDSVLDNLLMILCNDFGFERGAIGLLEPEGGFLVRRAVRGYSPETQGKLVGTGIPKQLLMKCLEERWKLGTLTYFVPCEAGVDRDEFIVPDENLSTSDRVREDLWHPADILLLTLVNGKQEIVGCIFPDSPVDGRIPSKEVLTELEILANLASVAIENAKLHDKMARKVRELEALYRTSKTVASTIQFETLLDLVTEEAKELGEARKSALFLLEEEKAELVLERSTGFSERSKRKLRYRVGEGIIGKVVLTGEGEIFSDIKKLPREEREFFENEGIESLLCVPIRSRGKALGALLVGRESRERAFSESELKLLAALGDQVSVALQNAMYYSRAQKSAEELSALLETSAAVLSTSDTKSLLSLLAAKASELLSAQNCTIFLLNQEMDQLTPIVAVGPESDAIMKITLKVGEGITGWVAKTGIPQRVNHAEIDPRSKIVPGTDPEPESLLSAPLSVKGRVVGVMTLGRTGDREFTEDNLRFLINISNQAAMSIEKSRLIENLIHSFETLKTTQEQLIGSERLKALGEMAAGVAHDFNNVLGSILARVQLLKTKTNDETLTKGLQLVEKAAIDGAETIRRIQNFTRTRTDEDFTCVDINEVIRDSIEMTRSRWRDAQTLSGKTISVAAELGSVPKTAGNPSELREVLTNIVMNAVDAMPEGGKITVRSCADDLRIHVSVSDTGKGMPKEVQSRIFEPFFTTKGVKGNGLGLSVSYGIIARHKGKIEVETEEGKGTTFRIELPIVEGVSQKVEDTADVQQAPGLRALVVDDEEQIRDVLRDIVVSFGHTVDVAQSGSEALALIGRKDYEIVLTDLGMPGMSGWELTREIKNLKPETIVILVTGWAVRLDVEKTRASKVDLVMNKPFQVNDVREILAKAANLPGSRHEV
ncbi:MAG: GAF domain-containing protein [Candidatus Eisenbacteria bacterium]|nr:GAF domain-containing protein [Candidatus Eisenbacteria bacterium]